MMSNSEKMAPANHLRLKKSWYTTCNPIFMNSLSHQNTQVLAHALYVVDGCPKDRALKHYWIDAERQLKENLFADNTAIRTVRGLVTTINLTF